MKKTLNCFYATSLLMIQGFTIKLEKEIIETIRERDENLIKGEEFFIRFETKTKALTKTVFLVRVANRRFLEFLEEYEVTPEFEGVREKILTATPKVKEKIDEKIQILKENIKMQLTIFTDEEWLEDINVETLEVVEAMLLLDSVKCKNKNLIMEIFDLTSSEKRGLLAYLQLNEETTLEDALKNRNNKKFFNKDEEKTINKLKNEMIEEKMSQVEKQELKMVRDKINEKLEEAEGEDNFEKKIEDSKCSEVIKTILRKELKKANRTHHGQEYAGVINYLETVLDLPWTLTEEKDISLTEAKKILDSHHYGLEKVKERILEILAVRKLNKTNQPLILQGPPGVGKSTVAKSIAEALGREFVKISLGGVSAESEIRGHRRTYLGSIPGRIIKALTKAKTLNPVILLDEIDKLGQGGYNGDPASALLEVLDPSQNNNFEDHFIEVPIDLSNVLFIATSNYAEKIPEPLLDRMEMIELELYTVEEKIQIAKKHLINSALKKSGLKVKLVIDDAVIQEIIEGYTMEAGVRELERCFFRITNKLAVEFVNKNFKSKTIKTADLEKYLGPKKFEKKEKDITQSKIGAVNGLAWTAVGGKVLDVQAVGVDSDKTTINATGNLQAVMKESTQVALTYLKTVIGQNLLNKDFYLHFPAAATPKDGPSAGITITTALYSVIYQKPVRQDIAMTGEISILGEVLPIGGVKEKVSGAYRLGIKEIILPKRNELDTKEIAKEIRDDLTIHFVETFDEVKAIVFK